MATQRSQRIGIWIIAIIMIVGTIGSFVVIILSNQNQSIDAAQTAKTAADTAKVNAENSVALSGYSARTFDANVTKLNVETLVVGTGAAVKATDTINVSYFGYLSDGTIFDSSTKKSPPADTPIDLSLASVIAGWTQGLTGVTAGSVVRLTIPSSLGYGATASGIIPANAPLEFIVEVHSITAAS